MKRHVGSGKILNIVNRKHMHCNTFLSSENKTMMMYLLRILCFHTRQLTLIEYSVIANSSSFYHVFQKPCFDFTTGLYSGNKV